MRTILFTGKGGVGKTTIAAATALKIAGQGQRTLVVSTDPAHSLGDAFDTKLANSPVRVQENLWAKEINVLVELSSNWEVLHRFFSTLIKSAGGLSDIISEEMAVPPGMDEVFGLMEIYSARESGAYDCMVIDCAPTAQTLRLLSLPDVARWWIKKILPVERKIARTIRPIRKTFLGLPIPTEEVYDKIEALFEEISRLHSLLTDPELSSVRLVMNPEKVVIDESRRAFTYLNLYGYPIDCVIVNRIMPPKAGRSYFREWRKSQIKYLEEIRDCFAPLPILESYLMRNEIFGHERLTEMADAIYKDLNPMEVFHKGQPQKFTKEGEKYIFSLDLPFLEKKDFELLKDDNHLLLSTGNVRREILLPDMLVKYEIEKAAFTGKQLKVVFTRGE